jgi:predicted LPLAT superfamily acyltransferase
MSGSAWASEQERGSNWALRSLFWAFNTFGYNIARALLFPIVLYFVLTGRRSRRASAGYFTRLHQYDASAPRASLSQVYLHHLEFAQTLLERVQLWQGKLEGFKFVGEGRELLEKPRESGCVLLGAHFGSFDALRILAQGMNCRVNVVMYRAHATLINKFLEELNPDANLRVVELTPGDSEAVLRLRRCIENGEHVALLADRIAPGSKQRVQNVPFLGTMAPFPENPWLLASIFACPVIFVAAARIGKQSYRIYVDLLAENVRRNRETLTSLINRFAQRLESLCIAHPRQWFNFYEFWQPIETLGQTSEKREGKSKEKCT